jgi:hypothetical protein
MKKLNLLSILFTFCILAFACGKDEKDSPAVPEPIDEVSPATPVRPDMPPADNASNDILNLTPLPASGVPAGFSSWDELNTAEPAARSLLTLEGLDPSQELLGEDPKCSVYVLAAYLDENGRPNYILRTSFKHNSDTHSWVRMIVENDSTQVIGKGSNGQDQIFLKLEQAGDLLSASRMNLKWFHINHFDVGICENLKPRT